MMALERVKLFGLNNLAIEAALNNTERQLGFPVRQTPLTDDRDEEFYPQFPEHIRREAAAMARHYEVFYCLETSIRQLVADRLQDEIGAGWWEQSVPETIRRNAEENRRREAETGMTPRSAEMIDFITFGELGQIISANNKIFGDTFRDLKAVSRIMALLNSLRAPIAHCCPLAEDEVARLKIGLKDWFRQMS